MLKRTKMMNNYTGTDITEELVFLGMLESVANEKNIKATIDPELPSSKLIYYKLDDIPDELCVSKKLGWEKIITFERKNLCEILEFLYSEKVKDRLVETAKSIDGDLLVLYGFGD